VLEHQKVIQILKPIKNLKNPGIFGDFLRDYKRNTEQTEKVA
jgi:hypothetical protein